MVCWLFIKVHSIYYCKWVGEKELRRAVNCRLEQTLNDNPIYRKILKSIDINQSSKTVKAWNNLGSKYLATHNEFDSTKENRSTVQGVIRTLLYSLADGIYRCQQNGPIHSILTPQMSSYWLAFSGTSLSYRDLIIRISHM